MDTLMPKRLIVELTNDCQRKCKMCPRKYSKDEIGYLKPKRFIDIIHEIKGHGITLIPFWRGESFLHKDLLNMIRYASRHVDRIELATGAAAWPQGFFAALPYIDFLSLSIHDGSSVELLREILKQKEPGKPFLQITGVKGEGTEKLVHMLKTNVDRAKMYEEHSNGGVWGASRGGCQPPSQAKSARTPCPRLSTDMVIAWDGRVSRCSHVWETEDLNVFGSGTKHIGGIEDVWNSPEWKRRREGVCTEGACAKCDQWGGATLSEIL